VVTDEHTFETFERRYKALDLSPERFQFIKNAFDTVCEIYSIPDDAIDEREFLALHLIVGSRSMPDDGKVLEAARKAVENYRQKSRKPMLRLVVSAASSHKSSNP
jgi:hypothetical protein